ncbi:MAG: preprotein translocase subunit YajC [Planctomycetes bacterium]|nr:preprotein translocase subunit YajC [Planctomycetota bacterium]
MDNVLILAQTGAPDAPARIGSEPVDGNGQATTVAPGSPNAGPQDAAPRTGSPWMQMLPLILIFVVMYFLLLRGPRRQQQQQKQIIQSLKKNDRVRTIGGIYGTVMDVKGDEVVLKVDEATNTKIRVSTSAISKNLAQEGKE